MQQNWLPCLPACASAAVSGLAAAHISPPDHFRLTRPISSTLSPSAHSVSLHFHFQCREMLTCSVLSMDTRTLQSSAPQAVATLDFLSPVSYLKKPRRMLFHNLKMKPVVVVLSELFEFPDNSEHRTSQLDQTDLKRTNQQTTTVLAKGQHSLQGLRHLSFASVDTIHSNPNSLSCCTIKSNEREAPQAALTKGRIRL